MFPNVCLVPGGFRGETNILGGVPKACCWVLLRISLGSSPLRRLGSDLWIVFVMAEPHSFVIDEDALLSYLTYDV